jgi:hypothetical protein
MASCASVRRGGDKRLTYQRQLMSTIYYELENLAAIKG